MSPPLMASHRSAAASFRGISLPLHFPLKDAKRLIDVVLADEDLHRIALRRLLRRILA
jgi:hypothetical protein